MSDFVYYADFVTEISVIIWIFNIWLFTSIYLEDKKRLKKRFEDRIESIRNRTKIRIRSEDIDNYLASSIIRMRNIELETEEQNEIQAATEIFIREMYEAKPHRVFCRAWIRVIRNMKRVIHK